jgi:hypothetical protein
LTKAGEPNADRRVQNKFELLKKMRSSGIWLMDASISALYQENKRLADGRTYQAILQACWESYVGEVVCGSAPLALCIIGKQVDSAIGRIVRRDLGSHVRVNAINQPNARMSAEEIALYRRQCFDLVVR